MLSSLPPVLIFFSALVILVGGAELLVRGAVRLSLLVGISPLMVGLTVVAFGTSSPELAVSLLASARGNSAIAVGNALGSNVFNVLFILGVSAIITPLDVARKLVRVEVPLLIGVSSLLIAMAVDGVLGTIDGLLLTVGLAAYLVFSGIEARKERSNGDPVLPGTEERAKPGVLASVASLTLIVLGLTLLVLGSHGLVMSATSLARRLGVSELVIALTIIAAGTSLPEVATSVVAAIRGQRDMAVGNVIGSNLFNTLGILGLSSLAATGGIQIPPEALRLDLPVNLGASLVCFPVFLSGMRIARGEGWLLLGYYGAYVIALYLHGAEAALASSILTSLLTMVFPLAALFLGVVWLRRRRL